MRVHELRINSFRLVSFFALAGALSACAPATDQQDPSSVKQTPTHKLLNASLDEINQKIQTTYEREACDNQNAEIKKELIEALKNHVPATQTPSGKVADTPSAFADETRPHKIPFADGFLIQMNQIKSEQSEWREIKYSWAAVHDTYLKLKDNGTENYWSGLNATVRSLLTDDFARVVTLKNFGLNKDNVNALPALKQKSLACKKNKDCLDFAWSSDELKTIREIPIYAHFQKKLDAATETVDKRKVIERLTAFISRDESVNVPHVNPLLKMSKNADQTLFTLPTDATSFTDDERGFLKEAIESVWKTATAQVQVEWVSRKTLPDVFQFFFQNEIGNRAYVHQTKKEIHLFSQTNTRAIAHEFGHVMGLPDHYYTVWNAEKCEYTNQVSEIDLMSIAETGSVTAEEWLELNQSPAASDQSDAQ